MTHIEKLPIGVEVKHDIEYRDGIKSPYRARVRWIDPDSRRRQSRSKLFGNQGDAEGWISEIMAAAAIGLKPSSLAITLADYGTAIMDLALRGLELKTHGPYLGGWNQRVKPTLGHLPVGMISHGAIDRAVYGWIADGTSKSSVKNTLAILVRVMEQAMRDELITRNPARVTGWQMQYKKFEDELDDPRSLALPSWQALTDLAEALVANSHGNYRGWGDVVIFAGATAARIGEVSGVRAGDINPESWIWTVRRQTTPGPGGLTDKGTKGKRARRVPLIPEVRDLVKSRLVKASGPGARIFTGPRGGRISTAVLRDATDWDQVVLKLGYEHMRRHGLRHTGLTWMADAGVPVHVLRLIAGHGSLSTTQRYLHPNSQSITDAGKALSDYLVGSWSQNGPRLQLIANGKDPA